MKYKIDLHCHTISSGHAYSTIQENINAAADKKLRIVGISDHAPAMPGGAHLYHFLNIKVIPKEVKGVKVLRGVEANIIDYDGNIDVPKEILEKLDYAIASLHPPCINPGTMEENTRAIVKAIKNPFVKIIGHPDDTRFKLNYEEVVKTAKEYGVSLEVNNSSLKPNSFREGAWENTKTMLNLCKKYKTKIILGSDAHISYDVGEFSNCDKVLEEVNFPEELIVNTNVENIDYVLGNKIF